MRATTAQMVLCTVPQGHSHALVPPRAGNPTRREAFASNACVLAQGNAVARCKLFAGAAASEATRVLFRGPATPPLALQSLCVSTTSSGLDEEVHAPCSSPAQRQNSLPGRAPPTQARLRGRIRFILPLGCCAAAVASGWCRPRGCKLPATWCVLSYR